MRPYPKPVKKDKKPSTIKRVSASKKFKLSDGTAVSQAYINAQLTKVYKEMDEGIVLCECCGEEMAMDHDHTIAQRRCKELKKTELIWSKENISKSCRACHNEWERYKSGNFEDHRNVIARMSFMKEHDKEGFSKRMAYMNNYLITNELRK